ncbi:MAG: hypothetical protein NDI60_03670 [Elusimicrobiales bacterium]|nr:hypothetical protein [Elusimicrobiales bacterium]
MKAIERLLPCLLLLACAAALTPPEARAQAYTPRSQQTFDYNPAEGENTPELQQPLAETTYEDAEVVNHPIYGVIMIYKYRWKNWVARALYLVIINIALLVIILSLSKTEEYNIIISYVLCGAAMTVSFWVFLCAVLLFQLNSGAWSYIGPISLATGAADFLVLMRVKRCDVSLTELKESFKKLSAASHEDPRLASVDGSPGDWSAEDYVR